MSEQWPEENKEGPQPSDELNHEPRTDLCTFRVLGHPSDSLSSEHPISSDDEVKCRKCGYASSFWQPEGTDTCMMCGALRLNSQYDV